MKNKVAPPFRQYEFDIYYGMGVCQAAEALEMGVECGLVQKSGSWYSVGSERIGQGKENARAYLYENAALLERVRQGILKHKGNHSSRCRRTVRKYERRGHATGLGVTQSQATFVTLCGLVLCGTQ